MQPATELTRELIRFNTINPPGAEWACAEHLAGLLTAAGFVVELVPFGKGRAQLLVQIGGTSEKLPLGFTGHLDTVPLGARPWSVDAFAAEIKGDRLYGRGSSDMKSGVAAFVSAAIALADRLAGTPGIRLAITAGEETGCSGAAALAATKGALGRIGALVVAEPTGNRPMVGHKGALWLEAETTGVTAHGSMPENGINAIYKAARAVSALETFDFNVARHEVLGAPTLNVGTIQGGININSVPDRATIGIDIRTIPAQSHAQICAQMGSYLGPDVALKTLLNAQSIFSDPHDPWIREVIDVAREVEDVDDEIAAAPYFTDASVLTPAWGDPPTVILGPGELAQAHQTDEYCLISRIEKAVELYVQLIRRWCRI